MRVLLHVLLGGTLYCILADYQTGHNSSYSSPRDKITVELVLILSYASERQTNNSFLPSHLLLATHRAVRDKINRIDNSAYRSFGLASTFFLWHLSARLSILLFAVFQLLSCLAMVSIKHSLDSPTLQ